LAGSAGEIVFWEAALVEKEWLVITDAWKAIDARKACFDDLKFVATSAR
jgi:hypothetical protein